MENYNVSLQVQAEDDYRRTDDYKRNLQTDHFRSSWVGNNPGGAGPDLAGLTQQAQAAASATLSAVLQQLPNLEHVHPLLSKHNKMGWEQLALSGGNVAFESILGFEIDGPDKLLVEILEAKELRPIVQGKTENVFCQIYLRSKDHHWSRERLRAMLPSHTSSQVGACCFLCHHDLFIPITYPLIYLHLHISNSSALTHPLDLLSHTRLTYSPPPPSLDLPQASNGLTRQPQKTYVVEDTLDPSWKGNAPFTLTIASTIRPIHTLFHTLDRNHYTRSITSSITPSAPAFFPILTHLSPGQKFLFPVKKTAVTEPRLYRLRVKVLTKETIRVGRFLGQVDIFLNSLKDQTERCGYPTLALTTH